MPLPHPIRVLVVDDDSMARAGVRAILSHDPDLQVVAEAADGDEVVEACNRHSPDVVLMDIRMQRVGGVDATALLQRRVLPPKVIVLTSYDLDRFVYAALEAGASGFLLKDTSPEDMRRAVHTVMAGEAFLSPRSTRHLVSHFTAGRSSGRDEAVRQLHSLSEREQEIARLVWEGLSNPEIAARLHLGEATVKTHLSRLMTKLDATSRVQVALLVERAR
ncbi:response regulator transcription factor [Mariniluteicoccus endophyticus]